MSQSNTPDLPPRPVTPAEARHAVERVYARHEQLLQAAEDAGDATRVRELQALIAQDMEALQELDGHAERASAILERFERLGADLDQ